MSLDSKLSCFILLCVLFNEICDGRAGIKLLQTEDAITPNIRYGLSDESKHVGNGMQSGELISDVSEPHEMVTPPGGLDESTSSTTGNSGAITEVSEPADPLDSLDYGYNADFDISSAAIASLAGG